MNYVVGVSENYLKYRWNAIDGFDMPLKVTLDRTVYLIGFILKVIGKRNALSIWKKILR